ncbi:hypothetical protein [Amycolatopsis sp. cmx-4-54]|uniref:hypothetical protein n=1 Tax=Amycolatopsis sp. cmx-4-54 TaxID=2790936 RepID=UPI00397E8299
MDDTPWDLVDPATSIGAILRDSDESDVIRKVVTAVVAVADRQSAMSSSELRKPLSQR